MDLPSELSFARDEAWEETLDHIHFWANQMEEHLFFYYLGLNDQNLKLEANNLSMAWKSFLKKTFTNRSIDLYKVVLEEGDFRKLKDLNRAELRKELYGLLEETEFFKRDVLERLEAGKWLGLMYPAYAEHVLDELLFFRSRLDILDIPHSEVVRFWTEINGEHAGMEAHLLDPSPENFSLVDQATQSFKESLHILGEEKRFMEHLSVALIEHIQDAHYAAIENPPKSIIHPLLLDHVTREGERALHEISQ